MKRRFIAYWMVICLLAFGGPKQGDRPGAREELQNLLKQDAAARKAGDKQERLKVALRIKDLLNDAGDAVLLTASAYSALRDSGNTLAMLANYADLGQSGDNVCHGSNDKFEWLNKSAGFTALCARLQQNEQTISVAKTAFQIPDSVAIPEDIDYDPVSKTFLLTSVLKKMIVRVSADGQYSVFANSPSSWPMMAVKIDPVRKLVWATEVGLHGFTMVAKPDWDRSALLCYDLGSGRLIKRIEGPVGTALGDMVLGSNGNPIVSDGANGGIYQLNSDTLTRIDSGEFISPQTMALSADKKQLIIPDYARGIGIMNLASRSVTWVRNSIGAKCPLNGVDGIYCNKEDLFLTQNGVNPEQVTSIRLDKGMNKVGSSKVIERGSIIGDPTHGVVIDGHFFFIVNSGWDNINDSGQVKNGATPGQASVMRY